MGFNFNKGQSVIFIQFVENKHVYESSFTSYSHNPVAVEWNWKESVWVMLGFLCTDVPPMTRGLKMPFGVAELFGPSCYYSSCS